MEHKSIFYYFCLGNFFVANTVYNKVLSLHRTQVYSSPLDLSPSHNCQSKYSQGAFLSTWLINTCTCYASFTVTVVPVIAAYFLGTIQFLKLQWTALVLAVCIVCMNGYTHTQTVIFTLLLTPKMLLCEGCRSLPLHFSLHYSLDSAAEQR